MNNSTKKHIINHLKACNDSFIPNLDSYVDIDSYSRKLHSKSTRFEYFENNKLIGLVAAYQNSIEREVFITNVSVIPSFQKKGISSSLLSKCISYYKNKKYKLIILEVNNKNWKAVNFYEKNKFKIVRIIKNQIVMELKLKRDYNREFLDTSDHKYAYNFDFDVIHPYMIKSFIPHFVGGNCLELGSFKGDFTEKLVPHFQDITCVEISSEAILSAKNKLSKQSVKWIEGRFEDINLPTKYDNIILTHVLEHIDDPIRLLEKINKEWLSKDGKLFIVVPNANAPSRQIAVKMGLIPNNTSITPSEKKHGHVITYTLDMLESHAKQGGLDITNRSGIFFKALANFQWDKLLSTDIISKEYLDGCYALGHQYPDLCSSIMLVCKKG